jgi:PhnB protein
MSDRLDPPDRTDPLDVLAQPAPPLAPSPEFAAQLRRRLEVALDRVPVPQTTPASTSSRGAAMSDTAPTTPAVSHVPLGYVSVTPYLCASGARDAIAFYRDVFGAVESTPAIVDEHGRVGHAEFRIGDAPIMISDEHPEIGVLSPTTLGGSATMFNVYVPDADATVALAREHGAAVVREVELQPYGDRSGQIVDPWGHRWSVNTHVEDVSPEEMERRFADEGFSTEPTPASAGADAPGSDVPLVTDEGGRRQGDLFYWTIGVRDTAHARHFFGGLFGWQIETGNVDDGFHIASVTPPGGMHGVAADAAPTKTLYFRVPDIQEAVARVRELGGSATDPVLYDSGWDSTCTDGQGTEFNLSQPAPKYA